MTSEYNILAKITRFRDEDIKEVTRRLKASNVPVTEDNFIKEHLGMLTEKLNIFPTMGTIQVTKVERIF